MARLRLHAKDGLRTALAVTPEGEGRWRDRLESIVLEGLRSRMMDPVLYKEFAQTFTAEWNRM